MRLFHDSRDLYYRAPTGAVTTGTKITMRLSVSGVIPEEIYLRTWDDAEICHPMHIYERTERGIVYQAEIDAPNTPMLWWYRFHLRVHDQWFCYANAEDGLGGAGHLYCGLEAPSYQITVYDANYAPPDWLKRGAMYQVFVDRFYDGDATGALKHVRRDVVLHEDWSESPSMLYDVQNGDFAARDFFGGNLPGLRKKLPYLHGLGITVLYLNPIFEAPSNHKYDTGDYLRVDPMYGTDADFRALCQDAAQMGMRVILDGVFSHSGADSRYFNRYGRYDEVGAYQSRTSKYAPWYTFEHFPARYKAWWGFKTLPEMNKGDASYREFFLRSENAVVKKWISKGSSGWRLDVADELPMDMLRELRREVKARQTDAAIIGEVWEDASNKMAYGQMRSYCLGDTLDSAMNYPLREVALAFMIGQIDAQTFARRLNAQRENYAPPFYYAQMNLISSHDRMRALNLLAGMPPQEGAITDRDDSPIPDEMLILAKRRMTALWRFICAMPGMPCIYYGDEVGVTGGADPLCRKTYPWGHEDSELLSAHAKALSQRANCATLIDGDAQVRADGDDVAYVVRRFNGAIAVCALNRGEDVCTVNTPCGDIVLNGVSSVTVVSDLAR